MVGRRNLHSEKKTRVAVAMSGGVDSSVAAALLVDQGFDVIGIMMRLWSEPHRGDEAIANRCCTPEQMADARRIARCLDIPFYVLDFQEYFRQTVVQFFIDQHAQGRTPNPCIECNKHVRFNALFNRAMALDADFLATGHYARIVASKSGFVLLKGVDREKDQSYVLHVLKQKQLAHTLFPIGEYTKPEVRELARKFGLAISTKQDSQDLCFLSDGDYRRFLREHDANTARPGPIIDLAGRELGRHPGLSFYTIGQRKGLGIAAAEPMYVLEKNVTDNALVVGTRESLGRQEMLVRELNWISGKVPEGSFRAQVKIRYRAKPIDASVMSTEPSRVRVLLDEPAFGVTPGQGAVFYDDDVCLGGGLISEALGHVPSKTAVHSEI